MRGVFRGRLVGAAAAVVGLLVLASSASAKTFAPTRHDDPAPGKCKPTDCSLREAIDAANQHQGPDTVVLKKGTYRLQIPVVGPDTSEETGDLNVEEPTTIVGAGADQTTVNGEGIDRVFKLTALQGKVSLRSFTVTGGNASQVPAHESSGGGLEVFGGDVTLKNMIVDGNTANLGGGIESVAPKLNIRNTTIGNNVAAEGGGVDTRAYFTRAVMTIRASTISGNAAGKGGGLLADGYTSSMDTFPPLVDFINSTVAGNRTSAEGGGIMADNNAGVTLDNTTVAFNMADSDNNAGGVGGGIHQHSGATFLLGDSIIDANTVGTTGSNADCDGTFDGGGNVVAAGMGCNSLSPVGNLFVGGAELGVLGNHGGPTQTIPIKSSSPAIGQAFSCPPKDQRGKLRPSTGCDSGSFERTAP